MYVVYSLKKKSNLTPFSLSTKTVYYFSTPDPISFLINTTKYWKCCALFRHILSNDCSSIQDCYFINCNLNLKKRTVYMTSVKKWWYLMQYLFFLSTLLGITGQTAVILHDDGVINEYFINLRNTTVGIKTHGELFTYTPHSLLLSKCIDRILVLFYSCEKMLQVKF